MSQANSKGSRLSSSSLSTSSSFLSTSAFDVPGFEYTKDIPIDFTQSQVVEEKIAPLNGMNSDPYDFVIGPTSDSFLCMNSMYIDGKFTIVRESGEQRDASDDDVAVINFLGFTLWRSIQVSVNDQILTPSSSERSDYKAVIQSSLSHRDRENKQLWPIFYHQDTSGRYQNFAATNNDRAKNAGHYRRFHATKWGSGSGFTAPIPVDFLRSDNHLAPGNKLMLRFFRNRDEFVLNNGGNKKYKLLITDLVLYARRIKLHPSIFPLVLHRTNTQRYQSTHTELKHINLKSGTQSCRLKLSDNGLIAKHVVVTMVTEKGFMGDVKENPLCFQPFNLAKINLLIDDCQFPRVPYTPDFGLGLFSRELFALHQNTGKNAPERVLKIGEAYFKNGKTFFAFDLSPDQCNGYHTHIGRRGDLELEMEWKYELTSNIVVLIHQTFDQIVSIDPQSSVVKTTHF